MGLAAAPLKSPSASGRREEPAHVVSLNYYLKTAESSVLSERGEERGPLIFVHWHKVLCTIHQPRN